MRLTTTAGLLALVALAAESRAQPAGGKAEPKKPAEAKTKTKAKAKAKAKVKANDIPVDIRLRRLEQRVHALKERAWRAKARVGMLKETVLGSGVGARAAIVHANQMGGSYRLLSLTYVLDGTQIFSKKDPSGALHREKTFDVMTGPIEPGNHTLSVVATYRGNGYGPIKYINKYRFTVRASHTFTAVEGKGIRVRVRGFEKGGVSAPLEKRPSLGFDETVVDATRTKKSKTQKSRTQKSKTKKSKTKKSKTKKTRSKKPAKGR